MNRRNKAFRNLLAGWVSKIVALLAAILLFVYGTYSGQEVRKVAIPLKVLLPVQMKAASRVPTTVEVRITGNEKLIYLVDPEMIKAYADFSDVKESGIAVSPVVFVFDQKAFVSGSITLEALPSQFRILFEKPGTSSEQ